ncbi:E3 ubiquitin-protein ligase UPL4 isoform X2 [Malania oleifera]|uniref:E3 ubiquitin-protein ligase UPL4 isoform X2 n=1 Tax=Malania oleifera TaxID=397392 RepID=UPI0025AE3C13|nr:E3 ubiquitin-protein ligase UPL4 isoform X2 [Malania oleifera]
MGNRGQKRAEMVDELPADKRACSSLEFRPSSSNSSVQMHVSALNSIPEAHDDDMDTSSSASASGRSDGEGDRDSAYGSCDSDEMGDGEQRHNLREYQRRRSFGDHGRFKKVLSSLSNEVEPWGQLAALTELCEMLSFCTESSLSSMTADSLSPALVKLAKHESCPDIMLLSIRAITYLCDVHPRSSVFLVRHDAVPALCQRLIAIEYLDVAEQCLQALEKISRDQPLVCLQSGAIMAVLNYIDFFSTSVQRVALSVVSNICKKLPSECPAPFMEAVPILCNLLQYEDRQLVESVASCLIKVVEQVNRSSEMLDELCKHGLIHQAAHLIDLSSRITLCQPIYTGLIGLLVKLASSSIVAVKTLFDLNISRILKDILSSYYVTHGVPPSHIIDGHYSQVQEVLKLLNELLPPLAIDQDVQFLSDKKSFMVNRPDLLFKFGTDILPMLIEIVNSGANLYVCYGCLSIINKLIYFSKPDMLLELLKSTNISSFLAGVFTRKDHHVVNLALQIAETILQKLSDTYSNSFVKEGVLFAVDALLMPEKCSLLIFPVISGIQLPFDSGHKSSVKEIQRCLCYAFDTGQFPLASGPGTCKLEKDSVCNLAKQIRTTYFASQLDDFDKGLTDILQKLRAFSSALTDLVNMSINNDASAQHEEFCGILHQIMVKINGKEPISTFEFIESGIVKALVNYLSNGMYLKEKVDRQAVSSHAQVIEKRFQVFVRLFLSMPNSLSEDLPLSSLIRRLQSALSSVENFSVILSHSYKQKNSYATVPNACCITRPCFKVRFLSGEGETHLCDYYCEDILTVDPLSSLDAIERFLWPKVTTKRNERIKSAALAMGQTNRQTPQFSSHMSYVPEKSPDHMEPNGSSVLPEVQQEDEENLTHSAHEEVINIKQNTPAETTSLGETHAEAEENLTHSAHEEINIKQTAPAETTSLGEIHAASAEEETQETHVSLAADSSIETEDSTFSNSEDALPKLLFYLEGQQVDRASTLYQAIIQKQVNAEHEFIAGAKLWNQVYTITYRRAKEPKQGQTHQNHLSSKNLSVSDKIEKIWQNAPFYPGLFVSELESNLEKTSPTYHILLLLKSMEAMNKFALRLMSREKTCAFAEGRLDNLDGLKVALNAVPQIEFVNTKLTEKLEQQMRDPLSMSIGGMPLWCSQLMISCPFLFGFEARCKFFRLAAFGSLKAQPHPSSQGHSHGPGDRRPNASSLPRKKFLVCRNRILGSAAQMMNLHACEKAVLEVEYNDEVGTGLGPTLEFYTLVSNEFQKIGLGMWREDHSSSVYKKSLDAEDLGIVASPLGLFPRPWSSTVDTSNGVQFSEVIKNFVLLGQVVAKAVQDGRVMDLPFSKAFYKLILGQELCVYDILSFDPELGKTLLEFQALVDRKRFLDSSLKDGTTHKLDSHFRDTTLEDLFLDFSLPGYPDYILDSGPDHRMVNISNLGEYVSLIVDATINSGISRQLEAFKSGFNQVFPIKHLQIFTEEELEHLLCGEHDSWFSNELLEHIKFDHGYTASSPPIVSLLEIIQEFDSEQRRAFLQFVTGAPRLPPGGLASLNPKLTIVRKHCSKREETDLPSVMTCANYLKLPAYSSKEKMREKLIYAITEGQGAFHLS